MLADMIAAFVAGVLVGVVLAVLPWGRLFWKSERVLISVKKLPKPSREYEIKYRYSGKDDTVYTARGDCTVWHFYPSGNRALGVERWLGDRWQAARWKEEEHDQVS